MLLSFISWLFHLIFLLALWSSVHLAGIAFIIFVVANFPEVSPGGHNSGLYFFNIGFFLLFSFSAIVLSLRLLEFGWKHLPFQTRRFIQAIFVNIGYYFCACLPSPRWTSKVSILPVDEIRKSSQDFEYKLTPYLLTVRRSHRQGALMLLCIAASVIYFGLSLSFIESLKGEDSALEDYFGSRSLFISIFCLLCTSVFSIALPILSLVFLFSTFLTLK